MARLDGKVILITGGAAGIGRASALMSAGEGASVAIADIDPAGEQIAQEIASAGGEALFVRTDVTDEASVEAAIAAVIGRFGRLTTLHNNAGGGTPADNGVVDAPIDEFWRAIRLDLFGTFLCSRYAIPQIEKAGGGSIINMTSVAGMYGIPGIACYSSAKGGVIALTRSMAAECAPRNIRVNAIAPGFVTTERALRISGVKAVARDAASKQALGAGSPEDIAAMMVYLASDESRFTTGSVMVVDGGTTSVRAG
jgi:NAD(P)-dependent dehydrogenase (short-subunit alcohol dehydrogenase family)